MPGHIYQVSPLIVGDTIRTCVGQLRNFNIEMIFRSSIFIRSIEGYLSVKDN